MTPLRRPASARRSGVRVGIAVLLVALTAAMIVLPMILLRLPAPTAPARVEIAPVAAAAQPKATSRPAGGSSIDRRASWSDNAETDRAGGEDRGRGAAADEPIVERQWRHEGLAAGTGVAGTDAAEDPARATPWAANGSDEYRQRRVRQFGGTEQTEDAVELGLAWLAAHQQPDGLWSRVRFSEQCPRGDRCPGPAMKRISSELTAGISGVALLAFLGAGYTDEHGPYQEVVARAVGGLRGLQQSHGGFSATESMAGYNDALATFALAEFYALRRDPGVEDALEKAVRRLVLSQQSTGGWDYLPRATSGRNDTSITAWAVQALQACAASGVHVPRPALVKAALHFARASGEDGTVWYADAGAGFDLHEKTRRPVYRFGPAMTAAGVMSEYLLGMRTGSALADQQQALLLGQLPSTRRMSTDPSGLHSYYYWYYGTIAMFQAGGGDWDRWNAALRDAILPLQERTKAADGRRRHSYGSWKPFGAGWGKWGRMGGRVYTTALNVLTLETYYRHTPAYLEENVTLSAGDWRAVMPDASRKQREWAVRSLREARLEIAEPVLIDLLDDAERSIGLAAAEALVSLDSPAGRALIERSLPTMPEWQRAQYEQVLETIRAIESLPRVAGRIRLYVAEQRLATLDLPRAYAGMKLDVVRDGAAVAELRVVQRFSGRSVAVAELLRAGADPPRAGDTVWSR